MEKVIYKYPLEVTDRQAIEMPKGAKILSVQVQSRVPCLWALVDANTNESEKVIIRTVGTGHAVYDGGRKLEYIGTYQLMNGSAVFHVFNEIEL